MSDAADVPPANPAPPDLVEFAAEVVAAYVRNNPVPMADMPGLLAAVHGALVDLGRPSAPEVAPAKPVPAVPIRKSVADDYLVSLEDGKRYKALKRHLAKHGLTPESYRAKWGLPSDYPMVAPAYSRARSGLAKSLGLGQQRRKR